MKAVKLSAMVLLLAIAMPVGGLVHAQQPPASPTPPTWDGLRCDELWTKAIAESRLSGEEIERQPDWTKDEHGRFSSCLHMSSFGRTAAPTRHWCYSVPETPPPPGFELGAFPGFWEQLYQRCSSLDPSRFRSPAALGNAMKTCGDMCGNALGRWGALSNPRPSTTYESTTKLQGPIRLPGGTTEYILPVPSAIATPLSMPSAPQGASDPGGPLNPGGYFAGEDLDVVVNKTQPPNVAADVSPTQNVEFINNGGPDNPDPSLNPGLSIWAKPTLPITSPPAPSTISELNFWCTGDAIIGQSGSQCQDGQPHSSSYQLSDTQIGYDPFLGRWIATVMDHVPEGTTRPPNSPDYVYVAVSNTGTAMADSKQWTKWSAPVCIDNPNFPNADQPLLGWSGNVGGNEGSVALDVVCFNTPASDAPPIRGEDNLLVVSNVMLSTTPPPMLPGTIVPPCIGMTPARDQPPNTTDLVLVAPIVPGDSKVTEPDTCGSNTPANQTLTTPYVVEYIAVGTGTSTTVAGSAVCKAGVLCAPRSQSRPRGNLGVFTSPPAAQLGCNDPTCMIDANDARIKAAQIREATDDNGITSLILTLGFSTGYQSTTMTGSQALWFFQDLNTKSWLSTDLIGNGFWFAYPTIAIDDDYDLYLGSTWFSAGSLPSMVWDLFSGTGFGNYTFEGQNVIERSTQEYTGDGISTKTFQRWGDYNSMIYDPNTIGPFGEPIFWQVEEVTCSSLAQQLGMSCPNGSQDESSSWVALEDPSPFFVGSSEVETDPPTTCSGYTLPTDISPPSGVQNGDVLIAILKAGVPTPDTTPTLPVGWTLLTMSNVGTTGSTTLTNQAICGGFEQSWIAVHTYSTSDTVPYTFTFSITPVTVTCSFASGCISGESSVYLNDYRFAGTDFTKYVAYGYPNSIIPPNTSTTTAITAPAESTVLSVFSGGGDAGESNELVPTGCETFIQPVGTPALTVESSLTPDCSVPAFLSADVFSDSGGAIGGYTESPQSFKNNSELISLPTWQVVIPEPNQ